MTSGSTDVMTGARPVVEKVERRYVVDVLPGTGPGRTCSRDSKFIGRTRKKALPVPFGRDNPARMQPEYFDPGDPQRRAFGGFG